MDGSIYITTLRGSLAFKLCKKCNEKKPLDNFARVKLRKDGRSVTCKACKRSAPGSKKNKNTDGYYARIRYET